MNHQPHAQSPNETQFFLICYHGTFPSSSFLPDTKWNFPFRSVKKKLEISRSNDSGSRLSGYHDYHDDDLIGTWIFSYLILGLGFKFYPMGK